MDTTHEANEDWEGRSFLPVDPTRYTGRGSVRRIATELMGRVVLCAMRYEKKTGPPGQGADNLWRSHVTQEPIIILPPGLVGWVVGVRQLPQGYVTGGYHREDPAEFTRDRTVQALLVAPWPTRVPVPVPMTGFVLTKSEPRSGLTWAECVPERMHDRLREEYREAAATMQRDTQGRFLS